MRNEEHEKYPRNRKEFRLTLAMLDILGSYELLKGQVEPFRDGINLPMG